MTKEAPDGTIILVTKQGNRIKQLGLSKEQRTLLEAFIGGISKENPLKSLPEQYDLHHNPSVLEQNNELYNYLDRINAIMWQSHMIKGRIFKKEDGEKVMEVLNEWATKY